MNDPNQTTAFGENTNATQTNPFTGDLKGEFTSDFGTNTNAVSQMFKGNSGFGGGDKKKTIFIVVAGVVVLALFGFLLMEDDDQGFDGFDEPIAQDQGDTQATGQSQGDQQVDDQDGMGAETDDASTADASAGDGVDDAATADNGLSDDTSPDETLATDGDAGMGEETMGEEGAEAEGAGDMASTGSITITSPFDGASLPYDETQGPATFTFSGAADRLIFARSSSMSPVVRSVNVAGRQSYRFLHPHPGTWYWRAENAEGGTAVQSFTIMPPVRRNFPVTQPQSGMEISGNGGVVAWQGDSKVARYAVQLVPSGGSWASPMHRFGTSGTSVALQNVAPGPYDLRVGAFSEVAGRWEWQVVPGVTVQ